MEKRAGEKQSKMIAVGIWVIIFLLIFLYFPDFYNKYIWFLSPTKVLVKKEKKGKKTGHSGFWPPSS